MEIRKAVIPAAGFGTRLLPATKAQPKEMLPIVDKPMIQYIVEEAIASGIEEILIVVGRFGHIIEDYFEVSDKLEKKLMEKQADDALRSVQKIASIGNIQYILQKEACGLGDAIRLAEAFVQEEPFAVMLCDDLIVGETPCLKQLIQCYETYHSSILAIQSVDWDDVSKYGILDSEDLTENFYRIKNLVEKPECDKAPSNRAILGRYIITPRIFHYLKELNPGVGHEIQLTDALKQLALEEAMYGYRVKGKCYDVGSKIGFLKATVEFGLQSPELKDEMRAYLKNIALEMEDNISGVN